MNDFCQFCETRLYFDNGSWVDFTDGDCCWGDAEGNNENQPHVLTDSPLLDA